MGTSNGASKPTIVEFVTDRQLLGLSLSTAQETLLRAIYGLPLDPEQLDLWRLCTGRETYPARPFAEVTVIAGARAGKDSRIAAPIVVYEAIFCGHEKYLSKGERGMIPLVAQDRRVTGIAFGYVSEYLRAPLLRSRVVNVLASSVELSNRMTVDCFACTLRSLRGWSIPVGVMNSTSTERCSHYPAKNRPRIGQAAGDGRDGTPDPKGPDTRTAQRFQRECPGRDSNPHGIAPNGF